MGCRGGASSPGLLLPCKGPVQKSSLMGSVQYIMHHAPQRGATGSSRARDINRGGKQDSAGAGGWLWEPEWRVGLVGTGREEIRESDGAWHWGGGAALWGRKRGTQARDVVVGGHQGNREGPHRYGPGVVSQSSGLKGCQERPEKPFQ